MRQRRTRQEWQALLDETVAWDVELSLPRGVVLRMRAG